MHVSSQSSTIWSLEERTVRVLPRELRASAGADAAVRWALPPLGHSHAAIALHPLPPKEFLAGVRNTNVATLDL